MTIRWSTGRIVQVMVRGVCGEGSAGGEGDVPKLPGNSVKVQILIQ